jgi:hypothetical protein
MSALGGLTLDLPSRLLHRSILHKMGGDNQSVSAATTYGSSAKSVLAALQLDAGNSSSRASTWLDDKFPVNIASYVALDVVETGAAGGAMPILCMRSTSPRLAVSMCANG